MMSCKCFILVFFFIALIGSYRKHLGCHSRRSRELARMYQCFRSTGQPILIAMPSSMDAICIIGAGALDLGLIRTGRMNKGFAAKGDYLEFSRVYEA